MAVVRRDPVTSALGFKRSFLLFSLNRAEGHIADSGRLEQPQFTALIRSTQRARAPLVAARKYVTVIPNGST
jgi:hypothetical protein